MARASFFLTKTDEDSIRRRQRKNLAVLIALVLVDVSANARLYFGREKRLGELPREVSRWTSAATFKDGAARGWWEANRARIVRERGLALPRSRV